MSGRRTKPIQEGASKRKERLLHLFYMVRRDMPDGVTRERLIILYAADTGLSEKKAEEHLDLIIECGYLEENDLRIFTTDEGSRWAGSKRDDQGRLLDPSERAEEEYRERKRKRAEGTEGPSDPKNSDNSGRNGK